MSNRFQEEFGEYVCFGDSIKAEIEGFTIEARVEQDDMGPPWEEHDGHGPVSEWTSRDKRPGEWVLIKDRDCRRYYDFQEAMKVAKSEGWGPPIEGATPGQVAEAAVKRDFESLKAWCNDEWHWCSVVLSVSKNGVVLDEWAASLGGIEVNHPQDNNSHLTEVANELLEDALGVGKAALESLCCK